VPRKRSKRKEAEIGQIKLFEIEQVHLTLTDRFLIPPFSVLEQKAGYWQDRKRAWLDIGIRSELGRDEKLLGFESIVEQPDDTPCPKCEGTGLKEGNYCRACQGSGKKFSNLKQLGTTSVFDPVLCELVYRWFCPPGGHILDPFAGGSVRGIVAAMLGCRYTGIDLRKVQVQANEEQRKKIGAGKGWAEPPVWITGDARDIPELTKHNPQFDMVFTCPPYYDLEQYSDDPKDLSNAASYAKFREAYWKIIEHAATALKANSFAAIVVGEVRDNLGNYVGLVPDTIYGFERAGMRFYNEAILVTPLGSAPVRTSSQFGKGRKLGKTHQQLLVFVKGDAKKAAAKAPVEEVSLEQGGAVFKADRTIELPSTGEKVEPEKEPIVTPTDPYGDGIPF
jgi:16S rRNA G966 N2-methylase RsmD